MHLSHKKLTWEGKYFQWLERKSADIISNDA